MLTYLASDGDTLENVPEKDTNDGLVLEIKDDTFSVSVSRHGFPRLRRGWDLGQLFRRNF